MILSKFVKPCPKMGPKISATFITATESTMSPKMKEKYSPSVLPNMVMRIQITLIMDMVGRTEHTTAMDQGLLGVFGASRDLQSTAMRILIIYTTDMVEAMELTVTGQDTPSDLQRVGTRILDMVIRGTATRPRVMMALGILKSIEVVLRQLEVYGVQSKWVL